MAVEVVARFAGTQLVATVVGPERAFRIGTAPGVDLAIEGFTSFPLVDRGGAIRVPVGVASVCRGDVLELVLGRVQVTIAQATAVAPIARPRTDRRPLPYVATVLVLHLIVWGLANGLAGPPHAIAAPAPVAMVARVVPSTPLPPPPPIQRTRRAVAPAPRGGGVDVQTPREAAIEAARTGSFLGSPALGPGMARLIGTVDLKAAMENLYPLYRAGEDEYASGFGDAAGRFDPTARPEFASVASGRYATEAHGRGAGEDFDIGGVREFDHWARARDQTRTAGIVDTDAGDVRICDGAACSATGALDRHDVTTWIAPHVDDLRACYARGAHADGTVMTVFTIGADGAVHGIGARGLGDVAPCVASVLSAVAFPHTDRVTRVRYPIAFRHT